MNKKKCHIEKNRKFFKKTFQNLQEITGNYCIIIGRTPHEAREGSANSTFMIGTIWGFKRMSPNHTILSARRLKLEVSTRRFSRKSEGGPPKGVP